MMDDRYVSLSGHKKYSNIEAVPFRILAGHCVFPGPLSRFSRVEKSRHVGPRGRSGNLVAAGERKLPER